MTKLLVGLDYDTIEIIDLESAATTCKNLTNFPLALEGSFGGLGFQDKPIICGTVDGNLNHSKKCFSLEGDEWIYLPGMNTTKAWTADSPSLYQSLSQAFFSGRGKERSVVDLNTTEDLTAQRWEEYLPQSIPFKFNAYCSVLVNPTTVLVIGSEPSQGSSTTYYLNIENEIWTPGPYLNNIRENTSCGKVRRSNNSQEFSIIVAGGWDVFQQSSVEILDQGAEEWRKGPELPMKMYEAKMVEDQKGGVILVGGYSNDIGPLETLLHLPHGGEDAQWTEMDQKLNVGRKVHVAFLVPDNSNAVDCY
jgi:hypothetical protein